MMTLERQVGIVLTSSAFAVLAVAVLACPPPKPPAPAPDADAAFFDVALDQAVPEASLYEGSTTSACFQACQALVAANCKEGLGNCITRLQAINDLGTEQNLANGKKPLTCADVMRVQVASQFVAMGQTCTPIGK